MQRVEFYIGTSGWVYPHWRGRFYPNDLAAANWLAYYAKHFRSVEINRSFYRLPSPENFAAWRRGTPANFVFSVKASRFITHMKKLKDPLATLQPLLDASAALQEKRGPLVFQLPPRWKVNPDRLRDFLQALPRGLRVAFEMRDISWHTQKILDVLHEFGVAFCVYDLGGASSPPVVTADFVYMRLHGPGEPYSGLYGPKRLAAWAAWVREQRVKTAYIYFDNDQLAYAVRDALTLRKILAENA